MPRTKGERGAGGRAWALGSALPIPVQGALPFRLPGPLSLPGLGVSRLPGRLYNACPQPLTLPCPGLIPERPSAHALPGNNLFVAVQHPEGSRVSSATSSALPPWPCHLAPSPRPQGPSNYGLKSALRFLHRKLHSSGKALTRDSFLLPELPDKTSKQEPPFPLRFPGAGTIVTAPRHRGSSPDLIDLRGNQPISPISQIRRLSTDRLSNGSRITEPVRRGADIQSLAV